MKNLQQDILFAINRFDKMFNNKKEHVSAGSAPAKKFKNFEKKKKKKRE